MTTVGSLGSTKRSAGGVLPVPSCVTCRLKTESEASETGELKLMRSSPLTKTSWIPHVTCPSPPAPLPAQPSEHATILQLPPPPPPPEQEESERARRPRAPAARERASGSF